MLLPYKFPHFKVYLSKRRPKPKSLSQFKEVPVAINVETQLGNKKIIHSAVLHTSGETEFNICINEWKCIVKFLDDDGVPRFQGDIIDNQQYIYIYNHKNTLGESITNPFPFAIVDGKNIWITYYTTVIGTDIRARRFEYILWMDI